MKCYNTEQLIAFAQDPLREENAQMAAHIAVFPGCKNEFELALEAVAQDDILINDADQAEARSVVKAMQANASENVRFGNMFQNLLDMIRGSFSAGTIRSGMAQTAAFGGALNSAPRTAPRAGADPRITFESCCGKESRYYWKMQMTLPLMVTESSRIMLKVSNAEGRAVENGGMLLFLGKKIPITAGIASIPLKLFIENTRNKDENSVRFMFPDAVISRGTIKFLPEAI